MIYNKIAKKHPEKIDSIVKNIAVVLKTYFPKTKKIAGIIEKVPGNTIANILGMPIHMAKTIVKKQVGKKKKEKIIAEEEIREVEWSEVVEEEPSQEINNTENPKEDILEKINQAKQMLDTGIISEEEFGAIKAKLIAKM